MGTLLVRLAAFAAIVIPALSAVAAFRHAGVDGLIYDECEYLDYALDTRDKLTERGLMTWPAIIATEQGYAKPPLFVNTLAAASMLVGRTRAAGACMVQIFVTILLLQWLAYWIGERAFGPGGGLGAALALGAMPGLGALAGQLYPEPLLAALVLATIALLFAPISNRGAVLGVAIGLGCLTKATYPTMVGLPLAAWWLAGSGRDAHFAARSRTLATALAVGGAIAALWYARNFGEALAHGRMSLGFVSADALRADGSVMDGAELLRVWTKVILESQLGWCTAAAAGAAILLYAWPERRGRFSRDAALFAFVALLAAAPNVFATVRTANVTYRLLLPALAPLVVLIGAAVGQRADAGVANGLRMLALSAIGVQWLAIRVSQHDFAARLVSERGGAVVGGAYAALTILEAPPERQRRAPVDATMAELDQLNAEGIRPTVWLASNSYEYHVGRLDMFAAVWRRAAKFDWGTYAYWSDERIAEQRERLRADAGVVAAYASLKDAELEGRLLNRHARELVEWLRAESGYSLWKSIDLNDGGRLTLYKNFQTAAERARSGTTWPLVATFGDFARATELTRQFDGNWRIEFLCIRASERSLKLMFHVKHGERSQILDAYPHPPTSQWQAGETYAIVVSAPRSDSAATSAPAAAEDAASQVEIGFFDEGLPDFPRLPRSDAEGTTLIVRVAAAP